MSEEATAEKGRSLGVKLGHGLEAVFWTVMTILMLLVAVALLAPQPAIEKGAREVPAASAPVSTAASSNTANRHNSAGYEIQRAMANCLAQPAFSGSDLAQKLFDVKDLKMGFYMVDKDKVSFMLPVDAYKKGIEKKISLNPDNIEWARFEGQSDKFFVPTSYSSGTVLLEGKSYRIVSENFLFSVPVADLAIDANKRLEYRFGNILYDVSPAELNDFLHNRVIKGGRLEFSSGPNEIINNRAPFIAEAGEPSFSRLAKRIVGSLSKKEDKIQALLDFVNLNIDYDETDRIGGIDKLKRPDNTMMVGAGNCGNRVILFASLLEQIEDVDYVILYLSHHVSIAVTGFFPNRNGLNFSFGGMNYSVADATMDHSRFIIGGSIPEGLNLREIEFIQPSSENQRVWSLEKGRWIL